MNDSQYMAIALELARRGGRNVAPNPMVGAVIVKNGKVIGRGYHCAFGGLHAEIEAIRSVRNPRDLVGSTLYVTLQPCNRFGKTPPCTRAIEKAGITHVVAGSRDPSQEFEIRNSKFEKNSKLKILNSKKNSKFNFKIKFLKCRIATECKQLNKFFFKWIETGFPYVTVKVAKSADGLMVGKDGERLKITNVAQDREVHAIRALHQAILVSADTVIADDPHLGVRYLPNLPVSNLPLAPSLSRGGIYCRGQLDPLRIILDSHLRTPLTAKVFRDHNVLLVCLGTNPVKHIKKYADLGISVWCVPGQKHVSLKALFRYLGRLGISSVLVEPGPRLHQVFRQQKLVDEEVVLRGRVKIGKIGTIDN